LVVIALWIVFIGFLVYGAVLLRRLRSEDADRWPDASLPAPGARFRVHPSWSATADGERLSFATGVKGACLTIEALPGGARAGAPAERLRRILASTGVVFDDPEVQEFPA